MSTVRMEWAVSVTARCQRTVADLCEIDLRSFTRRFDQLADDLPPAADVAEHVFLLKLLRTFADVCGRDFHEAFHRGRTLPCRERALIEGTAVWAGGGMTIDPRCTLREWAHTYEAAFDQEHSWSEHQPRHHAAVGPACFLSGPAQPQIILRDFFKLVRIHGRQESGDGFLQH